MRILVVEGSGRGFLSQYSHALAMGLHGGGDQVRLLTGARDELAEWEVPFEKRACLARGTVSWWCLRRQVDAFSPEVVHLQWIDHPLAAIAFVRWAHTRGIAVVYTPHNILPHERRWISLPLYRALYRRVDRVVVRDRHMGWALEEVLDTPQEQMAYLAGSPNPLALDLFPSSPLPELVERHPGEFRALFFGHGCARKGLNRFLQVVAGLKWPSKLHLVVAGEDVLAGVDDELLKAACSRLHISVIDRYLHPPEVKHLFSHGDLLVLPYRKQCKSPLMDLAAAFGMPVLRSDRVQGAGFRDGEHGLTYPHDRPELLVGLLQGLVLESAAMEVLRGRLKRQVPVLVGIHRLAEMHRYTYRDILSDKALMDEKVGMASNAATGRL